MSAAPEGEFLAAVAAGEAGDSIALCQGRGWSHESIYALISSLGASGYVTFEKNTREFYALTGEGEACVAAGSPEYRMLQAVKAKGGETTKGALVVRLAGRRREDGKRAEMGEREGRGGGERVRRAAASVELECGGEGWGL